MEENIFPVGSRVRIVSYGPFRGLKGTVRRVDSIPHLEEPFCFYLIQLEGARTKEPLWFEHDELELVGAFVHISLTV
jgi:hypothetical protein